MDMSLHLLKRGDRPGAIVVDQLWHDQEDTVGGIRCPLCEWRPSASSLWCCVGVGTPEPAFQGCGTLWHTFSTRGRCPGCQHQWQWTSCLRCEGWSRHEDWYER
jgi:hypothetical protein